MVFTVVSGFLVPFAITDVSVVLELRSLTCANCHWNSLEAGSAGPVL